MYDYKKAVREDAEEAIKEWIKYHPLQGMSAETIEDKLNDALWIDDNVTGNASGSYTFCVATAREYVLQNFKLLEEALDAFQCKDNFFTKGFEWADVTIRCYLLSDIIHETCVNGDASTRVINTFHPLAAVKFPKNISVSIASAEVNRQRIVYFVHQAHSNTKTRSGFVA